MSTWRPQNLLWSRKEVIAGEGSPSGSSEGGEAAKKDSTPSPTSSLTSGSTVPVRHPRRHHYRKDETAEERRQRRMSDCLRQKQKRRQETPEEQERRRLLNRLRQRKRRSQETPEEQERRRALNRIRQQERRRMETPEEQERRRSLNRIRQRERRRKKAMGGGANNSESESSSVGGWGYSPEGCPAELCQQCVVCEEAWPVGHKLEGGGAAPGFVCPKCRVERFLQDSQASPAPPELRDLSAAEKLLIARSVPVVKVYPGAGGGTHLQGEYVASNLPRSPADIAQMRPSRRNSSGSSNSDSLRDLRVRRATVEKALRWLKHNSAYYHDVVISAENLNALPIDGIPFDLIQDGGGGGAGGTLSSSSGGAPSSTSAAAPDRFTAEFGGQQEATHYEAFVAQGRPLGAPPPGMEAEGGGTVGGIGVGGAWAAPHLHWATDLASSLGLGCDTQVAAFAANSVSVEMRRDPSGSITILEEMPPVSSASQPPEKDKYREEREDTSKVHKGEDILSSSMAGLTSADLTSCETTFEGKKFYQCRFCPETFAKKHGVRQHLLLHSGGPQSSNKPQFTCGTCGKGFSRQQNLRNHEQTHSRSKPYQCDMCQRTFSFKGNLHKHMVIHSGDGSVSTQFQCRVCKKGFPQLAALQKHLRGHPEVVHPFQCDM